MERFFGHEEEQFDGQCYKKYHFVGAALLCNWEISAYYFIPNEESD